MQIKKTVKNKRKRNNVVFFNLVTITLNLLINGVMLLVSVSLVFQSYHLVVVIDKMKI